MAVEIVKIFSKNPLTMTGLFDNMHFIKTREIEAMKIETTKIEEYASAHNYNGAVEVLCSCNRGYPEIKVGHYESLLNGKAGVDICHSCGRKFPALLGLNCPDCGEPTVHEVVESPTWGNVWACTKCGRANKIYRGPDDLESAVAVQ